MGVIRVLIVGMVLVVIVEVVPVSVVEVFRSLAFSVACGWVVVVFPLLIVEVFPDQVSLVTVVPILRRISLTSWCS